MQSPSTPRRTDIVNDTDCVSRLDPEIAANIPTVAPWTRLAFRSVWLAIAALVLITVHPWLMLMWGFVAWIAGTVLLCGAILVAIHRWIPRILEPLAIVLAFVLACYLCYALWPRLSGWVTYALYRNELRTVNWSEPLHRDEDRPTLAGWPTSARRIGPPMSFGRGLGLARIVGMTQSVSEWSSVDPIHGDKCNWIWLTGDYYVFLAYD